jgi:hypothetical protein
LKRFMLDDMYERVRARMTQPLPEDIEQRLTAPPGDLEAQLVRAGYLTRLVETETFDVARQPMPWLADLLRANHGDLALELALEEPEGKPAPSDPAARTWQVPGPGGHVRYFVASRWSGGDETGRRSWLYGFFLRCCEEAGPSGGRL